MNTDRVQKARADISKAILNLSAAKQGASAPEIMALSRAILTLADVRKKLEETL